MNLKKILAGSFAGVMAISAMAVSASAADVVQEAFTETINLSSWKTSWKFNTNSISVLERMSYAQNTRNAQIVIDFPTAVSDFSLSFSGTNPVGTAITLPVSTLVSNDDKTYTFEVYGPNNFASTGGLNLQNFKDGSAVAYNASWTVKNGYEYITEKQAKTTVYTNGAKGSFKYKPTVNAADRYITDKNLENQTIMLTPDAKAYDFTNNVRGAQYVRSGSVSPTSLIYKVGDFTQDAEIAGRYPNMSGNLVKIGAVVPTNKVNLYGTVQSHQVVAVLNHLGEHASIGTGTLQAALAMAPVTASVGGPTFAFTNAASGTPGTTQAEYGILSDDLAYMRPTAYGALGTNNKAVLDAMVAAGKLSKTEERVSAGTANANSRFNFAVTGSNPDSVLTVYYAPTTTAIAANTFVENLGTVDNGYQQFAYSLAVDGTGRAQFAPNANGQFNQQFISGVTQFTKQNYVTVGNGSVNDKDNSKAKTLNELREGLQVHFNDVLGNTKGSTVTFNFEADSGYEDYIGFSWAYDLNKMFGMRTNNSNKLQLTGYANPGTSSLTFDWDQMLENSGLTINSTGLLVDTMVSTNGPDLNMKVKSITLDVPENSFNDLSAGEGATDSASDIAPETTPAETQAPVETVAPVETPAPTPVETVAPVVTDATTKAVSNPKTGNAPIALAVIPVAIAAAAIIAKKRG